jgi:hypothetical protein
LANTYIWAAIVVEVLSVPASESWVSNHSVISPAFNVQMCQMSLEHKKKELKKLP